MTTTEAHADPTDNIDDVLARIGAFNNSGYHEHVHMAIAEPDTPAARAEQVLVALGAFLGAGVAARVREVVADINQESDRHRADADALVQRLETARDILSDARPLLTMSADVARVRAELGALHAYKDELERMLKDAGIRSSSDHAITRRIRQARRLAGLD